MTNRSPYGLIAFDVMDLPAGGRAHVEILTHGQASINAIYQVDQCDPSNVDFRLLGNANNESVQYDVDRVIVELVDGSEADLSPLNPGVLSNAFQPQSIDAVWINPIDAHDVNGDGRLTPIDALIIINRLNRKP